MTDPAAAVEPGVDIHEHAGIGDPNAHHHSPEQIRKEMKVYLAVFAGLAVLTAVTVGACYGLNLPVHQAIVVALIIASIKGFLVAGFFMHLLSEKKVIYGVLILTVIFFIFLMMLPVSHHANPFGS
ncbi:MAG TPA: cytochrome C oxidase subunit IV family protein [Thermoanaerobaculia bacterium]|nr:cytochrome C oxidase subunit IV family protein [Thermoanaerobaculia bacterium]